jgi:hypothetical protein
MYTYINTSWVCIALNITNIRTTCLYTPHVGPRNGSYTILLQYHVITVLFYALLVFKDLCFTDIMKKVSQEYRDLKLKTVSI